MYIKNKLLLTSAERQSLKSRPFAKISILNLAQRFNKNSMEDEYFTELPFSQKYTLNSREEQHKHIKKYRGLRPKVQRRKNNLEFLPKLNQYEFPFEESSLKQLINNKEYVQAKLLPVKNITNNRQKRLFRAMNRKDQIDKKLLEMAQNEQVSALRIRETVDCSLQLLPKFNGLRRNSFQPKLQNVLFTSRQLSPTKLHERISDRIVSRSQSNQRYQLSNNFISSKNKNKYKKNKQLKGWETKLEKYDILQF